MNFLKLFQAPQYLKQSFAPFSNKLEEFTLDFFSTCQFLPISILLKVDTVPLKSKLTVPRASILEPRDSILDSFESRVSSLESRVSSLESRVSSCESKKLMSLSQAGRKPKVYSCE